MKHIFLIIFTSFVFAETFLTFQNINGLTAVENGIELIEPESYATNCILKLPFAHDTNYYKMSKTPDFSTAHNDATVQGATWVSATNGYSFDGVNDYINLGDKEDYELTAGQDMTYAVWFKKSARPSLTEGLFDKRQITSMIDGFFFGVNNAGYVMAKTYNQAASATTIGTTDCCDGDWHLAVCILDRTGNQSLYVDNVLQQSVSMTSCNADLSNTAPAMLGKKSYAGSGVVNFNGQMDDFRIYNRALTSTEILNIYNATSPAHPN